MLGHVIGVGEEHDAVLVSPPVQDFDPWAHEITSKMELTWARTGGDGGPAMQEPWSRTAKRLLKFQRFFLVLAPRPSVSDKLSPEEIVRACERVGLLPPSVSPSRRIDPAYYTVASCGHSVPLTFRQVPEFSLCPVCLPPEENLYQAFLEFLHAAGLTHKGTLTLLEGRDQFDRSQMVTVECLACDGTNRPRTYDQVRYRGFRYCDQSGCDNYYPYPEQDIVGKPLPYYVDLFKQHDIGSPAQAQQLFPFAMQKLKNHKLTMLSSALGWRQNHMDKPDRAKLRTAVEMMLESGARTIGDFLRCPDPALRSEIYKAKISGLLHEVLTDMDVLFKQTPQIRSLEDAQHFMARRNITTWGQATSAFPTFARIVIELGLKDELFTLQGWSHRKNHTDLSDRDLLQLAVHIFDSESMQKVDDLERTNSGLVSELRKRNLSTSLRERLGLAAMTSWIGKNYQDVLDRVRSDCYLSSTDLHKKLPGLYKYAATNSWLAALSVDMGWGRLKDCKGIAWQSYLELIVANLLHMNGVQFDPHPKIKEFSGQSGGRPIADMGIRHLDGHYLWVEVWAFASEESARENEYFDGAAYWKNRLYKQDRYRDSGMDYCSIEGELYYRSCDIDGITVSKGFDSFIDHAASRLTANGIAVEVNDQVKRDIRASCFQPAANPVTPSSAGSPSADPQSAGGAGRQAPPGCAAAG
jgi:hypothetical protein